MKTSLLLVDDHQMFIDGIAEILANHPKYHVARTANNGKEALTILQKQAIDIVVADVTMPVMGGEELLKQIKTHYPSTKVIMVTMVDQGKQISKLIRGGAESYLFKDATKAELLEALDHVSAGETFFNARIQKALLEQIVPVRKANALHQLKEQLTEREQQILQMIAQEFTQEEIANQLAISPNTVVYHKRKLMLLLEVKSAVGLVRKSAEMGLL